MHGRRTLLVALCALVATALTACGGDDRAPTAARTSQTPAATATPKPRATPRPLPVAVPRSAPGAHKAPDEQLPVLMYHVITAPPPGTAYPELWVSREDFADQMGALSRRGYHGVTLRQVFDAWNDGGLLPSKPIVISFDDGYRSHYEKARPVLQKLGWPGVLNLKTGNLDEGEMTRSQVRGLLRAGWELASHTLTHADLTTLGPADLERELVESRALLRKLFKTAVDFFCYPAGRYNASVVAAVKAAGYEGALSVDPGLASKSEPFTLKRVRVNGSDSVEAVVGRLAGLGLD